MRTCRFEKQKQQQQQRHIFCCESAIPANRFQLNEIELVFYLHISILPSLSPPPLVVHCLWFSRLCSPLFVGRHNASDILICACTNNSKQLARKCDRFGQNQCGILFPIHTHAHTSRTCVRTRSTHCACTLFMCALLYTGSARFSRWMHAFYSTCSLNPYWCTTCYVRVWVCVLW